VRCAKSTEYDHCVFLLGATMDFFTRFKAFAPHIEQSYRMVGSTMSL
jgi:hypothetical protein